MCLDRTYAPRRWCDDSSEHHYHPRTERTRASRPAECNAARSAIVERLSPDALIRDAVMAGDGVLQDGGLFAWKEYDFGRIGVDIPELPRLLPSTDGTLTGGEVIVVHAAVRVPDGPAVFLGAPIVVTQNGADELIAAPWNSLFAWS